MLSIDKAIARERELSEGNLILLDFDELVQKSYDTYLRAEYHEQIVMWLEELKVLKENSISKEAFEKMKSKAHNHGYRQGYAKALNDFVQKVKEHQYVLSDVINSKDYGMFTVGIEQIAEELKEEDK